MTSAVDDSSELAAAQLHVAVENIRRWRDQPVQFVREVLHLEPDAWQLDVLAAFPHERQIAGCACKGPGKTALMSWLGWNFLSTRPHPKVPCTSITGTNLKDGLWAEFALWQKRSPWLKSAFKWTSERIFSLEHPETWFATFRTFQRDADPKAQADTLAGLHADFLLFLIDEVSEIPDGVVAAAEAALASGIETRLVMMGNPTRTEGPLYAAVVLNRRFWFVVHINGDPDDPKRSPRISVEWARQQIEKYGRESNYVSVNILGRFPKHQSDKVIGRAELEEAMDRGMDRRAIEGQAKIIGVDVARFGEDDSIFAPRQGRVCFPLKDFHGLSTTELGDELISSMDRWGAHMAAIDETGVGAGTIDHVRARQYGARIRAINNASRAQEPNRFVDRRAEMLWRVREWVKRGGCLPHDTLLRDDLAAPAYWLNKGRICVEPKEEIKLRLGRSPDRGDGFMVTFAEEWGPAADLATGAGSMRVELPSEDPFATVRVQLPSDNPFQGSW